MQIGQPLMSDSAAARWIILQTRSPVNAPNSGSDPWIFPSRADFQDARGAGAKINLGVPREKIRDRAQGFIYPAVLTPIISNSLCILFLKVRERGYFQARESELLGMPGEDSFSLLCNLCELYALHACSISLSPPLLSFSLSHILYDCLSFSRSLPFAIVCGNNVEFRHSTHFTA